MPEGKVGPGSCNFSCHSNHWFVLLLNTLVSNAMPRSEAEYIKLFLPESKRKESKLSLLLLLLNVAGLFVILSVVYTAVVAAFVLLLGEYFIARTQSLPS